MLFSKSWLTGMGERALKTFVQALIPSFIITAPITAQPWLSSVGIALTATVLSIATSVLNADFTAGNTSVDSADLLAAQVDPESSADEDGPQHLAGAVSVSAPSPAGVQYPSSATVSAPGTNPAE